MMLGPRFPRGVVAGLIVSATALGLSACGSRSIAITPSPDEQAPRGVVMRIYDRGYRVEGQDRQAVTLSVQAGGVLDGQRRYLGFHRWEISWKLESAARGGACVVTEATVYLDTGIILPEWIESGTADNGLREEWSQFLAALKEHELGHRRIAREGAGTVRQALLAVSAPSCDLIEEHARVAAEHVLQQIRLADTRYDEETRHGTTQGAFWPPAR